MTTTKFQPGAWIIYGFNRLHVRVETVVTVEGVLAADALGKAKQESGDWDNYVVMHCLINSEIPVKDRWQAKN